MCPHFTWTHDVSYWRWPVGSANGCGRSSLFHFDCLRVNGIIRMFSPCLSLSLPRHPTHALALDHQNIANIATIGRVGDGDRMIHVTYQESRARAYSSRKGENNVIWIEAQEFNFLAARMFCKSLVIGTFVVTTAHTHAHIRPFNDFLCAFPFSFFALRSALLAEHFSSVSLCFLFRLHHIIAYDPILQRFYNIYFLR